ncbi:DUF202 domain-containing protein [Arthrobacter sp. NPDC056691]|uniref:DUF202 domain-containing protein n=1 Tax=Arthrobacter sp. NPDC056691 TaxID=3345913 RepID=UPI003671E347
MTENPAPAPPPGNGPYDGGRPLHADRQLHGDPGLQPERTALAWGRTVLTLIAASAVTLRWIPDQGPFVLAMFGLTVTAGSGIYLTQRRRYRRSIEGIRSGRLTPDTAAVLWTAGACVALGAVGIWLVLS